MLRPQHVERGVHAAEGHDWTGALVAPGTDARFFGLKPALLGVGRVRCLLPIRVDSCPFVVVPYPAQKCGPAVGW